MFGSLKKIISRKIAPLLQTQIHHLQRMDYLAVFIEAYDAVVNITNIESALDGTDLIPFNPCKMIRGVVPR